MAPRAALALALGLAAGAAAAAAPVELSEVRVTPHAGGVRVEVSTSAPPRYRSELIDGPWRVVIDFEDARYGWAPKPLAVGADPVREIRGSQYRKGVARLVIELTRRVPWTVEAHAGGLSVLLGAPPLAAPAPAARPPAPAAPPGAAPAPAPAPPPAPPPRAPARAPELQGIVLRDDGPVAYIVAPGATQARGYRVGDALGGGVIETIGERRVVLRTREGTVELRLDIPKPRPTR